jgi:hypothetical protein
MSEDTRDAQDTAQGDVQDTAQSDGVNDVQALKDEMANMKASYEAQTSKLYKESKSRQEKNKALAAELAEIKATKEAQELEGADVETRVKSVTDKYEQTLATYKEEKATLLDKITKDNVQSNLISAASKYDAIDPQVVYEILKGRVRLDEDFNPVVYKEDGQEREYVAGVDMTVDQFVEKFLAEKPYLVKATNQTGAGSTQTKAGKGGFSAADIGRMTPEEYKSNEAAIMRAMQAGQIN